MPKGRTGYRLGHGKLLDSAVHDGLWDAYNDYHMGCTGEVVADRFDVTREEQDEWSFRSHQRAAAAADGGEFAAEILPVSVPQRRGDPIVIDRDEPIRGDTSVEALARLRPSPPSLLPRTIPSRLCQNSAKRLPRNAQSSFDARCRRARSRSISSTKIGRAHV